MKRVCVFCGSQTGANPLYVETAREFGRELVRRDMGLVYGGGRIGLMGEVASAVSGAGGNVIGVIPHALAAKEVAYAGATELIVVNTMHERKAIMADRADAFVALPGGFGTGDELFEILTWAQLGIHSKPIALLNILGFFDPLQVWLDHMVTEGFLKPKYRSLLLVADSPASVFDAFAAFIPMDPPIKWVHPAER